MQGVRSLSEAVRIQGVRGGIVEGMRGQQTLLCNGGRAVSLLFPGHSLPRATAIHARALLHSQLLQRGHLPKSHRHREKSEYYLRGFSVASR